MIYVFLNIHLTQVLKERKKKIYKILVILKRFLQRTT